jgi:chromosome segregation ATPase
VNLSPRGKAGSVPPPTPAVASGPARDATDSGLAPPPTRIVTSVPGGASPEPLPVVEPMPEVPDSGVVSAARYAVHLVRGLLARRSAVKTLHEQIRVDTTALDHVLGALGRAVRDLRIDNRSLEAENQAIDEAERKRGQSEVESKDLAAHLAEENQRFAEIEADREAKLRSTEAALQRAEGELEDLEAQRRSLRDKRKQLERQQKAYVKAAEEREDEAAKMPMGDVRAQQRRAAEELRRDAAALDPERQDLDRRLAALDKPASQASAAVETLKAEEDSMRRGLTDVREGHRQRLGELEAQQGHKGREAVQADNEVARRLVTLGTIVNLNRIERPELDELYRHIDELRGAINSRTSHIDRLNTEREGYDRGALLRGAVTISLIVVLLITAIVLLIALL